jgi:hypothetical protein
MVKMVSYEAIDARGTGFEYDTKGNSHGGKPRPMPFVVIEVVEIRNGDKCRQTRVHIASAYNLPFAKKIADGLNLTQAGPRAV